VKCWLSFVFPCCCNVFFCRFQPHNVHSPFHSGGPGPGPGYHVTAAKFGRVHFLFFEKLCEKVKKHKGRLSAMVDLVCEITHLIFTFFEKSLLRAHQ
jgi:hypothetical protein